MFNIQLSRDECDTIQKALREYITLCHRRSAKTGHLVKETKTAARAAMRVSSATALYLDEVNKND